VLPVGVVLRQPAVLLDDEDVQAVAEDLRDTVDRARVDDEEGAAGRVEGEAPWVCAVAERERLEMSWPLGVEQRERGDRAVPRVGRIEDRCLRLERRVRGRSSVSLARRGRSGSAAAAPLGTR
jgi:hypothetical protein